MQKVTKIDVSTRAAVIHYLRSIHVNAKHVVIQRGVRNYAGAGCPGKGWTCAGTRHTVVQIAKPGGRNRFACRTAKCAVVQFGGSARVLSAAARSAVTTPPGPVNTASCIKTTGVTQSCMINQPNATGTNKAVVWMVTPKLTGLTQSANYTASITQGPASGASSNWNVACVQQSVTIDGSTTKTNGAMTTVTSDAHESVTIRQNSLAGNNMVLGAVNPAHTNSYVCATDSQGNLDSTSPARQDQVLQSVVTSKGPITQNQDTTFSLCGDGVAGEYANLCFDVEQNQAAGYTKCTGTAGVDQLCPASGTNTATFTQNSTQAAIANTTKGPVYQTQSTPLCSTPSAPTNAPADCQYPGGLVGTVNQDSSGQSIATPTQNEYQCEDAKPNGLTLSDCLSTPPTQSDAVTISGGLHQTQYGPVGVGNLPTHHEGRVLFSHLKGLGTAHQAGNSLDQYTVSQISTQIADRGATQLNLGKADCTTDGACTASQTTTVNGGTPTKDGYTAPSITGLTINCPTTGPCVPTPPPVPTPGIFPPNPNFSSNPTFTWSDPATDATFECKVDTGSFTSCTSGSSFTNTYGDHSFQVRAVDQYGNHSDPTTEYDWTNVPPTPTILTGPADQSTSNSPEASFTFLDSDSNLTFRCSIDGGTTYFPCSSPQKVIGLADGSHTFSVKATDGAGHFSTATSRTWTVQVFTWSGAQLTATNVDIGEFGVGGMRGSGTGSIGVTGVSGTVLRAYLYWNGPTNSTDPNSNASVTFNGNSVTGTNIGTASDNNWGFLNSQSYRADVSLLVNGDGTYTLNGFLNANADINGVSLIVFYDDGNTSNDRNVVLWNGDDSNLAFGTDPGGWAETLSGVQYPGSGNASLDLVVADGQTFDDPALVLNGANTLAADGPIFQGTSVPTTVSDGNLWDVESFGITSLLTIGSNTLSISSADPTTLGSPPNTAQWDALSLVVAIANTPAS